MVICKHCGEKFLTQVKLLNHSRWFCTGNPKSKAFISKITDKKIIPSPEPKKIPEKEISKGKIPDLKHDFDEIYANMKDEVQFLQLQSQLQSLKGMYGGASSTNEPEKLSMIVDGVSLKVTPGEMLSWKKYLADQKRDEEEREARLEDRKQRSKPDDNLTKEIKEVKEQFRTFQEAILQSRIKELETRIDSDPLSSFLSYKERLDKLTGSTQQSSAQEKLYQMDSQKLETMLKVFVKKADVAEGRFDTIIDIIKPFAKDYVQSAVLQRKQQQRGEAGEAVPRTEAEMEDALKSMDDADKAMTKENIDTSSNENEPEPDKKVVIIARSKSEKEVKTNKEVEHV